MQELSNNRIIWENIRAHIFKLIINQHLNLKIQILLSAIKKNFEIQMLTGKRVKIYGSRISQISQPIALASTIAKHRQLKYILRNISKLKRFSDISIDLLSMKRLSYSCHSEQKWNNSIIKSRRRPFFVSAQMLKSKLFTQ